MIIAGTGHRPNKLYEFGQPYSNEQHYAIVDIVSEWLSENTVDKVISGMAIGFDQALAAAAIKNNIPLIAAVPFQGQELRWNERTQEYFNQLIDQAEDVVYVCASGYAGWKMQKRNEWMVDNCDVLLALWNGDIYGGTANCIKYARSKGRKIVNLWKDTSV